MRKKQIKNYLKTGFFLTGILLLLSNCQNEYEINEKQNVYKTVSFDEALNFFNSYKDSKSFKTASSDYFTPNLNQISQEKIINSQELLTIIPATSNFKDCNSRILLLKINENIESVVFTMIPNQNSVSINFTGIAVITDLNWKYLNGYRIEDGVLKTQISINKKISNKGSAGKSDSGECSVHSEYNGGCFFCNTQELNEVAIVGNTSTGYVPVTGLYLPDYTQSGSTIDYGFGWDYSNDGGGGYPEPINCGPGYYLDEYDVCQPDKIFNNLTNPCAKNIFTELENGIYTEHPLKPEITIPNDNLTELNFSEIILKLFNDSNSTNLIIENDDIGDANAHTIGATITLNNSYIENATQLSIARTIIHESVHAYLNALYSNVIEFNSFTFREKMEKYASDNGYVIGTNEFHHNFMGQFVNAMAYSLYEWDKGYGTGGNLGWDYYYALGFGGLFQTDINGTIVSETDDFKSIIPDPNERQKIANIILNELKNNEYAQGTDCD